MPKQRTVLDITASGCCTPMVTEPLAEAAAIDLARGFKALGDPVRLRLLSLIASSVESSGGRPDATGRARPDGGRAGGEVCVCDLTNAFDVTGPTISHHLKVLREAGLIDCERRGTWVYYWIVPSALAALSQLLDASTVTAGIR